MKVSDLLESRQGNWRELEVLCEKLEGRSRRALPAAMVCRFSSLYRAACADLALADAYQLPPGVIEYLHQLVGRAHNQLYRSRTLLLGDWARQLLVETPQKLYRDGALRLALAVFWGVFILAGFLAATVPGFDARVIGQEMMTEMEQMYSRPMERVSDEDSRSFMLGYYIRNNIGIGLRCFAFGLAFGIGGLFELVFNAALLGAVFGHMAITAQQRNFFMFVTAHGPFELTAIVLSAAAGMRMGFAIIDTRGLSRGASLRRAAIEAMSSMGTAMILFALAALIEGFLSPSSAPYWIKAATAIVSAVMLLGYFFILGRPPRKIAV